MALDTQLVDVLLLFNADLDIRCLPGEYDSFQCYLGTSLHLHTKCTPLEYLRMLCYELLHLLDYFGFIAVLHRVLKATYIARSLVMAGAVVHKDTAEGKSASALYQDWAWMENTVQKSTSIFTEEERQEAISCITFIKRRLTHPPMLTDICRYKIRRILNPDFHRKLAKLHLPHVVENCIAMEDIFLI